MKKELILLRIKIGFRVLIPILLLILPADFFDKGKSVCLSKLLFNTECPACGLTRGCMHLIHFQFQEAFVYNMFSFVALPVLAAFWAYLFIKEIKALKRVSALN